MTRLTLKAAQAMSGKTQTEIARYMNVSRATVCYWMRNYKQMKLSYLVKLCEFIQVDIRDLDY